jgi:tetratricopeptide (TPR) repeat protein
MTRNLKLAILSGILAAAGLAFVYSTASRFLRAADENVNWPALSLLAQTKGYGRALDVVDTRLASHPKDALMHYFKARLYYEQGDGKEALAEADKAIGLGYAQEISHLLKALIYGRLLGDRRRQKELASRALALSPAYDEGYLVRAEAEYSLGEYKACAADSDSFSNMGSGAADGYEYALLCRQALHDYAGAEAAGLKILKLRPAAHAAFWRLGLLYEQEGLRKKAIKNFSEAIRLNANRPQYYLDRARVCEEEGDYSCAAWDYGSAMGWQQVSGYASYYYLLGSSLYRVGELKTGLAAADKAVGMQPLAAANYGLRGRLRADSGDFSGARADFLKMSSLEPSLSGESSRLISLLKKKRGPDKL